MRESRRLLPLIALPALSALALVGCATGASTETQGDGRIGVVASTNVYGQIASEVGGDHIDVTSIVTSSAQDPHGYEASAQDQLTISRADLIIENGGGYDSFIDGLIDASGTEAHVITAVEHSHGWPSEHADDAHADDAHEDDHADDVHADGEHADDHGHVEGFNEHVWYDPHAMEHVAEAIAEELGELLPDEADAFAANAADFVAEIEALEEGLAVLGGQHGGAQVFVTEPVPLYLIAAAALENATPEEFSEAVEEGRDVPPATLLRALALVESGEVRVVITNAQTGGAETMQVITAAETAGIPVIEFSEILPGGQTYISWMQENIDALGAALAE